MNAKKLKRILCVALSLSMALSGNMTAFATEANVPDGGVAAVAEDMASEDAADKAAEDTADKAAEDTSDIASEDVSGETSGEASEDAGNVSESTSGEASEDTSGEVPEGAVSGNAASGEASEDVSGKENGAADGKEDSQQADAEEGTAEDSAQELSGAREADQATPSAAAIVVCDHPDTSDTNQKATLSEAITAATAQEDAVTAIRLEKDVELSGTVPDLAKVTIEANGHTITIPVGADVTLTNATISNSVPVVKPILDVRGKLTIQGGSYKTKGVCVISSRGETTIRKSENAGNTENAGNAIPTFTAEVDTSVQGVYYADKAVIEVIGINGKLAMESGKIEAATLDSTKREGMYGVVLFDGAEIVLGTEADATRADSPNSDVIINSGCPAISMNGLHAPGRITVHSGTYTSILEEEGEPSGDTKAKFNSVIYLPAAATVQIDGGVFEHKGNKNSSIISIPYNVVNGSSVRLNLNITGGTFKAPANSTGTVTNQVFRLGPGVFQDTETSKSKVNITVSGGTFSSDIKAELNDKGISKDFEVYDNGDGTFGVEPTSVAEVGNKKYNSFSEAVAAAEAITAGEKKLTLRQNVTLAENLTISGIEIATSGKMITVPEGLKLTLDGVTVKNNLGATYVKSGVWSDDEKNRTIFHVDGTLDIQGGTYETKGVHMIRVSGEATIGKGSDGQSAVLSCTAEQNEYAAGNAGNYDGAPLISVTGKRGDLTITEATINANVGVDNNNGSTDGMYGVYVNNGAKLTLGTKPAEAEAAEENAGAAVPKIESKLAAIGMNGTTAPGTIVIEDGIYISHAACTKDTLQKFNSVLYLPATANVTINGGTFENQGNNNAPSYVVSVPYAVDPDAVTVKLNLIINDGVFNANTQAATKGIFFAAGMKFADGTVSRNRISIRGGEFNCNPSDYVAGCCTATPDSENSPTKWTVRAGEAAAHTLTWVAKKDATCWEEGVIGHYECLKCHRMYQTRKDKVDTSPEKFAIPKEEHGEDYTHVSAESATCIKDGTLEYYQCNKCGMCYVGLTELEQDEKGVGKTSEAFAVKAAGHKYQTKPETAGTESGQAGEEEGTTPKQVPDAAFTGWEAFEKAVIEGKTLSEAAELLDATRTCQALKASNATDAANAEKCGHVLHAASITVEQVGTGSLSGSCDELRTVTYVAKATFTEDAYEKPIANAADYVTVTSEQHPISLPAGTHTYTVAGDPDLAEGERPSLTFDWSNFSSADFKSGESNGVTVKGSCSVCGKPIPEDTKVSVTAGTLPSGVNRVDALTCQQSAEFTAAAKSGTGENVTPIREVKKTLFGDHTLKVGGEYKAPDCKEPGRKAYYTCANEGCGKNFWDEADAKENKEIKDETGTVVTGTIDPNSKVLEIAKKDHTFKLSGFAWADKAKTKAKATLRCTGCYGTVVVENLNVTEPTDTEKAEAAKDTECGGNVTWNYHVALDFDKSCVEEGDNGFTYVPKSDSTGDADNSGNTGSTGNTDNTGDSDDSASTVKKIQHYEATLPKTVKQPHLFVASTEGTGSGSTDEVKAPVVQLSWADGKDNNAERVTSAHIIKAKVTCQRCGKYVTVKENSGPIDGESETNMETGIIIPIITKELDTTPASDGKEAATFEATCQKGGRSTYNVTVTYRDDDGKMQTLAANQTMATKTPQDDDAHNWTALDWEWEQVTTGTGENEKPVMTTVTKDGKTYTVPDYRIKATRYCQNEGCQIDKEKPQIFLGRLGAAPDGNSTVTENPSKWANLTASEGAAVQISTNTVEKTCITSGKTTYTATAFLNGKEVAANPTPAVYNDPPKGHQIVFDWNWKEKTNGAGGPLIGFTELVVTRSCSECSHKPEGTEDRFNPVKYKVVINEESSESTGGILKEDGTIVPGSITEGIVTGAILKVTRTGSPANCTTAGNVTYKAELSISDLKYTNERTLVNAALKHDVRMFIDWKETKATEGQTIADRDKWVPYLTKKCSRTNCPGGDDVTPVTKPLTLLTGEEGYKYTPENCTKEGTKVWATSYNLETGEAWDDSQFKKDQDGNPVLDNEGKKIVETFTKTETILKDTSKHVYGKGTATWDDAPRNLGKDTNNYTDFDEVASVTLSRTCTLCNHLDVHNFDARVSEDEKPENWDCSNGYTAKFKVSQTDMDTVKGIQFVEETEESGEDSYADGTGQTPEDGTEEKLFDGTKSYTVAGGEGRKSHALQRIAGGNTDKCDENTHPTYYECQRCKRTYTTQSALTEYTGPKKGDPNAVLGHLYGDPEFQWIEEGKIAEAVFTCKRSGCPDKVNGGEGHKYRLVATLAEDPYIETPAKCIGCIGKPGMNDGKGQAWGLVTVTIKTAEGGLKEGAYFEAELPIILPAGKHSFDSEGKCEWCGAANQAEVTFKKDADTELSTGYYAYGTADSEINVPTAPSRYNYEFKGWKFEGESDDTACNSSAIAGKIAEKIATQDTSGAPTKITVVAVYQEVEKQTVSIKVQNVYRIKNDNETTEESTLEKEVGTAEVGSEFTVTAAKDTDEKYKDCTFSHWELDEKTVSTSESYLMIVQAAVTLKAVYVNETNVEKRPTAIISDYSAKQEETDKKYKLSFSSAMNVPDGYTFVESGFVYATSTEENAITEEELVVTSTDTKVKKKSLGGDATNILTLSLGTTTDKLGLNVYIRAYLRCSNATTGQIVDVYSGMLVTNYNLASQPKVR